VSAYENVEVSINVYRVLATVTTVVIKNDRGNLSVIKINLYQCNVGFLGQGIKNLPAASEGVMSDVINTLQMG